MRKVKKKPASLYGLGLTLMSAASLQAMSLIMASIFLLAPLHSPVHASLLGKKRHKKPHSKEQEGSTSSTSRYVEEGLASWYGGRFHGRKTACGERYNMYAMTAAHRTLAFGTRVKVTNLRNSKSVVVRINDRGPWVKSRIIDLSYAAAKEIGMLKAGEVRVRVEELKTID